MILHEIVRHAPSPFASPARDEALEVIVDAALEAIEKIPAGRQIATGKLLALMAIEPASMKNAAAWLRLARLAGFLDGCFTKGPPAFGTFRKPSYKWHQKAPLTDTERQALIDKALNDF